ncbi:MAG: DUF2493 domain-containing protein [Pseudonocardiaceae bacterium]|nr:DUF2493 domain-containing protein [Pseudonocardiaceae bacterium]
MRVLITGSRTWRDTTPIRDALASVWRPDAVLISGGARGADRLCESCWSHWGWPHRAPPSAVGPTRPRSPIPPQPTDDRRRRRRVPGLHPRAQPRRHPLRSPRHRRRHPHPHPPDPVNNEERARTGDRSEQRKGGEHHVRSGRPLLPQARRPVGLLQTRLRRHPVGDGPGASWPVHATA